MDDSERVTAAVMIIGDEILSGRTQDTNLRDIARYLATYGVDLAEARVVPDDETEIVETLNHLRARWDYVITTGGIGPTHDDITADCVARAFGVALYEHLEIIAMMESRWKTELNAARRRMALISGCSYSATPKALATQSAVMSSCVGPIPPVVIT